MKSSKSFIQTIYICFIILSCLVISKAQTAQQGSIAITPASIDATVKSGASYTQTFTITNNTDARLQFQCSIEDMGYDENNRRITGRPGTLPRSASPWVQFTPSEISIEPHASQTVKAVITIPQDAAGSFFTVPVFQGMPVEKYVSNVKVSTANSTANIGIKFRGLILLTTEKGAEYNIEILDGKIIPPTNSSELELTLNLRNRGTAHARVRGAFAILNSSGALVGRGNIDEKRYLPAQNDAIKAKWAGELPSGNYTCVTTLSYNRVGLEPFSMVYELPFTVK
ncbi:MAG: hypothetical protein K1X72_24780 [Pyrinomonadaceae bacterium]|nr:hypothetical protein [Pyrinomonadaceae bacterium]